MVSEGRSYRFAALPLVILCCGFLFTVACQSPKASFTKADIEKLRWIEGSWRGVGADVNKPFFERYRFTDEGRLETASYGSDASFTNVENSGSVYIENGEIIHKGGDWVWTASKVTDSLIEFMPKEKATNSFQWKKESNDKWLAVLSNKGSDGKITETVYRMERIKQ